MKTSTTSISRKFSTLGVLTLLTLLAVWPATLTQAASIYWTNGTASYTVALNWDSNAVPGSADNAINNNGTNNVVQINPADPAWTVVDPLAGTVTGTGGAFELNGSSLNVNGWLRLALATNSTGRFTLNAGTLNFGGGRIQTGEGRDSFTVININGGVINRTNTGGQGLNFSDGGWGGQHSATTLVTQTAGTINTRGETWIGQFTGGVATYNLQGGAINSSNWFVVSRGGAMGTLNMSGGTILHVDPAPSGQPAFIVGDRAGTDGGVGILNFSGGSISTISAEFWLGNGQATAATNNMNGNTSLTVNHWMAVGRDNSVGELNLSGNASVTKTGNGNVVIGTGNSSIGGLGIINQNGGAFTVSSGEVWLGENGISTGIWTLNSGQVNLGVLDIAHANSANGTFNLNGGTLTATEVRKGGSTGTATFNFNGGTLRAVGNNNNFLHDISSADIQAGGAVIDSQGFDITATQTLTDNSASGGSVTKLGTGTLKLAGNNSYTGPTLINGGKLISSTAASASGNYTVANSAGFGLVVMSAGGQTSVGNLTLGSPASLDFDLGGFGNPVSAPLNVSGTLAVNGTITVNIADTEPQVGQFPLIQYATKTGAGSFVIGTLPVGVTASIVDNTANNSIDLNITVVNLPRWDGQAGGNWDIALTTNWVNIGTGLPTFYGEGNSVRFDDNALGTTTVNLVATVNPGNVTANNSLLAYTLVGSGRIAGGTGLTKQGTATFTIANTTGNTYTGPTRVQGGTLSVTNLANGGSASAIGSSSSNPTNLVLAGGTLSYSGAAVSTDRGYSFSGTNSIETVGNVRLGGTVSPTAGSVFLKTGPGTLAYTKAGTNQLGNGGAGNAFGAYNAAAGTVLLDGPGGGQTNFNVGEFWVGGTTNSGGSLVMSNSTLNSSSWVALGRGNGSDDFLSTIRLENSTINVTGGGFSAGFDAGLPVDLGFMVLARQQVTLNGNSALQVANGPIFIAERRGSTASVFLNGNSRMTNSANAGVGIGAGGSLTGSTGTVEIAGSALWRVGSYFSLGHEGGVGSLVVKDSGSFIVGTDLNVTDVGASTGTLRAQDASYVEGNIIFVGKDDNAAGVFTIMNNANAVARSGIIMGRHWQGYAVTPIQAEVNLAGGTLAAGYVQGTVTNDVAQGTFNFNGGRLLARSPSTQNFMFNLAAINVMSGGATIDSDTNSISIAQALLNAGGGGGLTKLGSGTLYLNGANTYSGTTLVSAGTLGGTGSISGPISVAAGGTLAPGLSIGTLTVSGALTFVAGSTNVMELNKNANTNDLITGASSVAYGGTLVLKNLDGVLAVNDTFKLFNASSYSSSFGSVLSRTPGQTVTWDTSNLTVDGTVRVASAVAAPVTLTPVAGGGNLNLSWPPEQLGWRLELQTNSLAVGINTNWYTVPGSTNVTAVSVPIMPGNPTVFFRLVFP